MAASNTLRMFGSIDGYEVTALLTFDRRTSRVISLDGSPHFEVALEEAEPGAYYSAMPAGPSLPFDPTNAASVICWFLYRSDDPELLGDYPPKWERALGPSGPGIVN
ncbi:MAG TPA: hypothetical protein VHE83_09000 [Mycobacteriales bacterium]|nr:hypothetical protein [Mycobacteriales bacterium]